MKLLIIAFAIYLISRMFVFAPGVEAQLAGLSLAFAWRVRLFFFLVKHQLGIDMVIVSGRRSVAKQIELHKQDARNPLPGVGKPSSHIDGNAVDINGYKDGKIMLLKGSSRAAWAPVVQIAQLVGLRWGGNFQGYPDNNHFDGL